MLPNDYLGGLVDLVERPQLAAVQLGLAVVVMDS